MRNYFRVRTRFDSFIINMKNKGQQSRIRIKDIARLAGVSEGTVDRVIHQRGEVSAKSQEAVSRALEELNYSPNLFARSLASRRQYRFVCLIPEYRPGDYWQRVDDGFSEAGEEFLQYHVHIERRYFNQFDASSFQQTAEAVLADLPDAVIMAPIFRQETLEFVGRLSEEEVPFSFVDSMLDEADFVTYYGQHSFQSGYIMAKLLAGLLHGDAEVVVVRTQRKHGAVSNQTHNRYCGFMQYMKENRVSARIKLVDIEMKDDDEASNLEVLREAFRIHKNIKAAVTFNSKVYRLAMHLEALGRNEVSLLGYDLLEKNTDYLRRDRIAYLIAQRPDRQAYYSVRDMCRKLIFGQPVTRIHYVPIDVLMKENIDYYTDFE